jgi:hypothetical protein
MTRGEGSRERTLAALIRPPDATRAEMVAAVEGALHALGLSRDRAQRCRHHCGRR